MRVSATIALASALLVGTGTATEIILGHNGDDHRKCASVPS
jgi:hypothetical protein